MNSVNQLYKHITMLLIATLMLLAIPLIAMQFSSEVVWTHSDFIIAGILLFGTGLTYVLATYKKNKITYRAAVGLALGASLFLIWSNLAVGLIGSESQVFNEWYFGIIVIGMIEALFSRFNSTGMAYTLFAMSSGILILLVAALFMGMQEVPGSSIMEILGVNAFFIVLFGFSGMLFLKDAESNAAQEELIKD